MGMFILNLKNIKSIKKYSPGQIETTKTDAKHEIHPQFFPEAEVFCNGEVVMKVGGTKKKYVVDIWSGNHPFFQGAENTVVVDEGQVNRFKKRFAGLENMSTVQTVSASK